MTTYADDARDYYALCDRAAELGIPTSLDDPASPQTVDDLRDAVREAIRAERAAR